MEDDAQPPRQPEQRRRVVRGVVVVAVLLLVAGLVAWLVLREDAPPAAAPFEAPPAVVLPTPDPPPSSPAPEPDPCDAWPRRSFVPDAIAVRGVTRSTPVVAYPRDANGVPGVPPVGDKEVFAWDLGGIEPGSTQGQVLLNTHTWPDGSAMGNRLLDRLDVGGRLVLEGQGRTACYRVDQRLEVRVEDGFPGYGATDGEPVVVIVVCSGERRGPGDWSHRTIWLAEPVGYPEPGLPDLDDVTGSST